MTLKTNGDKSGDEINIFKNDEIVDTIPAGNVFVTHTTCFDSFDLTNDIYELRHSGNNNGNEMHIDLVNKGTGINRSCSPAFKFVWSAFDPVHDPVHESLKRNSFKLTIRTK